MEQTHMRLRIPNYLKDWLKKSAERNIRSQNAEVIFLLEWAREKISVETARDREALMGKQNKA